MFAGHCSQEPVAPGHRLFVVTASHERGERESRVAQPAVPVVPVPHPTEGLGQRGCRGRDDPSCRLVGEGLQSDRATGAQRRGIRLRTVHIADHASHHATVSAIAKRSIGRTRGRSCDGYQVSTNGTTWPVAHREFGNGLEVLCPGSSPASTALVRRVRRSPSTARPGAAPTGRCIRSRTGSPSTCASSTVPFDPFDQPDHLGMVLADGHAVGDPHRALVGGELRLEYEGVLPVSPAGGRRSQFRQGISARYPFSLVTQEAGEARL